MENFSIVFRGLPAPGAALLALALGAAAWVAYRRERRLVSRRAGWAMAASRLAVVALLALLFADAAIQFAEEKTDPAKLLLLFDGSASMNLVDGQRPEEQLAAEARALGEAPGKETLQGLASRSRLQLARSILEAAPARDGGTLLSALERRYQVLPFLLREDALELPPVSGGKLPDFQADGKRTDLGEPVLDAAIRKTDDLFSIVLLVSDGGHNSGKHPAEALGSLRAAGIPVFTLGAGAARPPVDIRIASLDAPQTVYRDDAVLISLTLAASGLGEQNVPLRIHQGDVQLAETAVAVPDSRGGEALAPVVVSFTPKQSGRIKLVADFPRQPGETIEENNRREFWLNIIEEKVKVLYLDGSQRWEYRYLQGALKQDPTLAAESFLLTRPPDRRLPPGFPRDRDSLFAFDVILLGDVDREVFTKDELAAWRDFITVRGGKLVLLAGEHAMPYAYAGSPLEELLPVRLLVPRPARSAAGGAGADGLQLLLTAAGERSSFLRLDPGRERNRELWSLLPRQAWSCPHAGANPGADVLVYFKSAAAAADAERNNALLVTQNFGAGRVYFSAIDELWRWRFRIGEEHHARYWGQVIRWLASDRLPPGDGQARIGTDQLRYEVSEKVSIRALIARSAALDLDDPAFRVDAEIFAAATGASRRVRLEPVPKGGGLFRGSVATGADANGLEPGEYRVRAVLPGLPGYDERPDRASTLFVVEAPPARETETLVRDAALLEAIAGSGAPGGRYLPLERAPELLDILPGKSRRISEKRLIEQWSLAWPVLILLAALLTAEWVLRKRSDLI